MPFTNPTTEEIARFEQARVSRRDATYARILDPAITSRFVPAHIHDAVLSYLRQPGKGLRPLLTMLCCGAAGGVEQRAVAAAAAIEVFHTWTLVHDDIIDRDDLRRGAPTVHADFARRSAAEFGYQAAAAAHYGTTVGILAGDLQQGWSYSLLASLWRDGVSPAVALELLDYLAMTVQPALLEGEMLDVQFSTAPIETLTDALILDMLFKKTAVLYQFAARAGAMVGQDSSEETEIVRALVRFAGDCGIAFQLQDDVLGIVGDQSKLGKPVGSDIREGKRTLIVRYALECADEQQRAKLLATLGDQKASMEDVADVTRYMITCGAIEKVRLLALRYTEDAANALTILPESDYKRLLNLWGWYTVGRDF